MVVLVSDETYIIDNKTLKFIKTKDFGEVAIFSHNGENIDIEITDLMDMQIDVYSED